MNIALLAPFGEFLDSYSLSHVVCGQARGLMNAGHSVEVWCMDTVRPHEGLTAGFASSVRPCLRPQKFVNDETTAERSNNYADDLRTALVRFKPHAVIAHDVCFQASYVDIARAVHDNAEDPDFASPVWLHYFHSAFDVVPRNASRDVMYRRRVPYGHVIVYPNASSLPAVCAGWDIDPERVFSCPNPRDPRTFWRVSATTSAIVSAYGLMDADIAQVYPLCITRAEAKGLTHAIMLFASMKRLNQRVRLLVCDANADCTEGREAKDRYRSIATAQGLDSREFAFLSDFSEETAKRVPNHVVSELFRFTSVFFFPTKAEACPLVLAEACQNGVIPVVNQTLAATAEYTPPNAIPCEFDTFTRKVVYTATTMRPTLNFDNTPLLIGQPVQGEVGYRAYIDSLAGKVVSAVMQDRGIQARLHAFRTYNEDAIARRLLTIIDHVGVARTPEVLS